MHKIKFAVMASRIEEWILLLERIYKAYPGGGKRNHFVYTCSLFLDS